MIVCIQYCIQYCAHTKCEAFATVNGDVNRGCIHRLQISEKYMKPEIIEKFRQITGAEHVLEAYEDRACYIYDASAIMMTEKEVPALVVFPGSTEEVSKILRLANVERIPIIPRGNGSNVTGGSIPDKGSVIMVMTRMNRILVIDRDNLIAELEPGVITADLQNAALAVGLFYPPDPASQGFSTMGGNVAECAGGPRCAKYGVTRDYVLGLEVVLPTGEIIRTGARTMKSVAGFDLTRLIIGSEGALAVITKIIVRLLPKPEAKKTMLVIYDDLSKACATVAKVFQAGVIPTTLELMDNMFINCIEDYAHVGLPRDAEAVLLIEVDGDSDILDKQIGKISDICRLLQARSIKIARDDAEAEQLWVARRASFAAVSAIAPTIIGEDATVPRDKIPQAVADIRKIAAKYDLRIAVQGHAGDGNLHATILCDERDPELMGRVEKAAGEIFKSTLALGGTLTGEHGIGRVKAKYLVLEIGEDGLNLMRAIKKTFDPNNILNPGQFLGEF